MSRPDPGLGRLADAVLLPGFTGTTLPDWLARRLESGLAGVAYFAHNIASSEQVAQLSSAVHAVRDGALVASDEEGGDVTRIEAERGSSWPGNAALGRLDDLHLTSAVAESMGAQARSAGVDLMLAPVADVHSNPANPVIGIRSFGTTAGLVARHAAAFVTGLHRAGVAACLKHFPGHGDTSTDSHLDLPVVEVDLATLRARDLPPFAAGIAAGARAVMTAHVAFPALDDAPATLSKALLDLLRCELDFDGVVLTDALDMRAIASGVGSGRGAVLALLAGADLICLGNPSFPDPYDDRRALDEVQGAVVDAMASGELDTRRVEEAAARVAGLASWLRQHARNDRNDHPDAAHGSHETAHIGRRVADAVLEQGGDVRLRGEVHVLDLRAPRNVAAGAHPPRLLEVLRDVRSGATWGVPDPNRSVPEAISVLLAGCTDREVVAVVDRLRAGSREALLLAELMLRRPDVVVVVTGLPNGDVPIGQRWLVTWGGGRVNAEAAVRALVAS